MSQIKTPYLNVLQSAMCIPAPSNGEIPIALDIKVLPDSNIPAEPFFGVWLLDVSGSMAGDRLKNAKQSLIEQVKILPEGTIFSLIAFEDKLHEIIMETPITSGNRQSFISEIEKLDDMTTTSLHTALEKGVAIIKKYVKTGQPLTIRKIILISDGDPTDVAVEKGNEQDPNYQKYFQLAREALEYKASIDTVGALGEHNVYLMYEIAKQSTGKYIFAENEQELKTKMIIATEQTLRIAFSQPALKVSSTVGDIELEDAVQYTPTVIRMPFKKVSNTEAKTFMRSFEAGDTYQILLKGKVKIRQDAIQKEVPITIMTLLFDFGKGITINKEIVLKFSDEQVKFKLNQDINKRYVSVFSQAEEIADCTIRGDAHATQRIQGDETKKVT